MPSQIKKLAPLAAFAIVFALIWATGLQNYFSFKNIAENQIALETYVDSHLAYAILAYMGIYIAAVAFSLPGATILSLIGGLLFGGLIGGVTTVVSATIGAICLFLIARTSIGDILRRKAGKWMEKIAAEFNQGAASYLLFLRLAPIFPFFVVNLAPALLGARLWTFCWTTFIGIMPGTFAISYIGAGIGAVLTSENAKYQQCIASAADICSFELNANSFLSTEMIIGLIALGVVALLPILIKKFNKRRAV
ncbi:MAG: TVP38/TMEM64 family protein [Rhizobiales bacterium]|nr:VTT domain-containing protein [Hyphomicrobiales bacterium]NRB14290.1 TVP38/TMEM64 family protein [Hyphomicrobiales bacterium]